MDINDILSQEELRAGKPYLSPAHVVTVDTGTYGVPYTTPYKYRAPIFGYHISAPEPTVKGVRQFVITTNTVPSIAGGGGQAPAISFTGVEDICNG